MKEIYRDSLLEKIDGQVRVSRTRDGHVVERYSVNGSNRYFVTLVGSHYCAHGDTLASAITDATWKDPAKRPSLDALKADIQKCGRSRKITINEFRLLTGACAYGCRTALASKGLDESPMTVSNITKHFPEWGHKLMRVLEW